MKTVELLLSRDEFRSFCLERDKHQCVICGEKKELSVHHIIERRLFDDGGYYRSNGATLCEEHHLAAENTTLSCESIRIAAKIVNIILPDHFYTGQRYTKWGDPILDNNMRMAGELFHEESVQRILSQGNVLSFYTKYVKYPRTYHLSWSDGRSSDDKILPNTKQFEGKEVIVTAKMDGENTTLYSDYVHARSLTYHSHPSRDLIKQLHASVARDIPEGWRVCGENLYAEHSIAYKNLAAYFLVFSIWNERNICFSWDETCQYTMLLGLDTVPVLYRGIWDESLVRSYNFQEIDNDPCEGYVVRVANEFHYKDFKNCVAKYVRANHVTTDEHWLNKPVSPNKLRK